MAAAGHFPALFLHPILQMMRPTILGVIFVVHRPWTQVYDSDDSTGGIRMCMESGCSLCAVALVGNARSAGELSWSWTYVQGVGKKSKYDAELPPEYANMSFKSPSQRKLSTISHTWNAHMHHSFAHVFS